MENKKERKPRGYWSLKENCRLEALNYDTKTEFKLNSPGAYASATQNLWLSEITKHMKICGNMYLRYIYIFIFENNTIYVGLTYDFNKRHYAHIHNKTSSVFKHIEKTNSKYEFKVITQEPINVEDAQILENEIIEKYRNDGWNILNKAKTGLGSSALGSNVKKWSESKCHEVALRYEYKKDFMKNNPKEYGAALVNGWLKNITKHMKELIKPDGYWNNIEHCRLESNKYDKRMDFKKYCPSGYESARLNNWLDELIPLKEKPLKFTKNECITEALKFNERGLFQKQSKTFYNFAYREGFLDEICSHMIETRKPKGYWDNKNNCYNESLNYKNRNQFSLNCDGGYKSSLRNGWLDEFYPKK